MTLASITFALVQLDNAEGDSTEDVVTPAVRPTAASIAALTGLR
jgi:hypothetical protein